MVCCSNASMHDHVQVTDNRREWGAHCYSLYLSVGTTSKLKVGDFIAELDEGAELLCRDYARYLGEKAHHIEAHHVVVFLKGTCWMRSTKFTEFLTWEFVFLDSGGRTLASLSGASWDVS